jgi:catechol-2,3-dioxygenase
MQFHEVRLKTADLEQQYNFYTQVLRLPAELASGSLTVQVGRSRLVLEPGAADARYHIAFDVPENQIMAAKAWLSPRLAPDDWDGEALYDFASWNAHAFYFFDPAGNILECIARHNQPNASDRPFAETHLLAISEVGLVVDNVRETVETLRVALGVGVYDGAGSDMFTAVGDEQGLCIVVKRGRVWASSRAILADVYPTTLTLNGFQGDLTLSGLPYRFVRA